MLFVKYLLVTGAIGLFVSAAASLISEIYKAFHSPEPAPIRWRPASSHPAGGGPPAPICARISSQAERASSTGP